MELAEAQDGRAALQQISNAAFDVAFLDYNMPEFSGLDILEKIKLACSQINVIIMASTPDGVGAERAHSAGADGLLKKPFYPADVDAVLERIDNARKPQPSAGQSAL